jgi:ribosomal protein L11 methyltransferase
LSSVRERTRSLFFCLLARVEGEKAAAALSAIFEGWAPVVSVFESAGAGLWQVETIAKEARLTSLVEASLALAAAANGGRLVDISEKGLEERDWLAENRRAFPPRRIGRFFIYGGYHEGGIPKGAIPIEIDAATAFGTGEHGSTRGCLVLMDGLRGRPRRILDLGTGSGILAIAAAKLWRRPVVASDIDPAAAAVARGNSRRNGVARLVRVRVAAGYRDRVLRRTRYDLVVSNILARPLALLARDLGSVLGPGGRALLSGFTPRQERMVLFAHRTSHLGLERRLVVDGWSSLLLKKGGESERRAAKGKGARR